MRIWWISKEDRNDVDNVGDVQRLSQIGLLTKANYPENIQTLKKAFQLEDFFYSNKY